MKIKGFKFGGMAAGIKKNGKKDLAMALADRPAAAAALFTKNQVKAAPVILGEQTIKKGEIQALLVNAGNANCFTGEKGLEDARRSAALTATALGIAQDQVLVSSTGVIGAPLPMARFEAGIPALAKTLDPGGLKEFAQAIMTTDTFEKIVHVQGVCETPDGPVPVSMAGVAKGSGMIRPDMATMLAYIFTDADIAAPLLKKALVLANERSFNRITVDGDTSTNDTLVCLASGAGPAQITEAGGLDGFQSLLNQVCTDLARLVVKDGEGATKVVSIRVKGAATQADAFKAAEAIAHSNLVKTAIYGEDPNWGRITAAAGRSGARVDQETLDLFFGDVALVRKGVWQGLDAEKEAARVMKASEIEMVLDLNLGQGEDGFLFCDFSENYVKINADYRS